MIPASSFTPAAATFFSICSGRDAPMMAEATFLFCSTQAMLSWAMVSPASSAMGLSCCTPVRTSLDIQRSIIFEPPLESVARLPSGAGLPGWYFPLSTPCAIGDQTIWERPSSSDVGMTSASMTRHSMEYCGWLEISWKPSSLARACPSRIWPAVHSLTPM